MSNGSQDGNAVGCSPLIFLEPVGCQHTLFAYTLQATNVFETTRMIAPVKTSVGILGSKRKALWFVVRSKRPSPVQVRVIGRSFSIEP